MWSTDATEINTLQPALEFGAAPLFGLPFGGVKDSGYLRREVPLHALMLGVMVAAMASHSAFASIAGAALLVVVSVPCAVLSRSLSEFRAHVLDLWAMALALVAFLPWNSAAGHHVVTLQSGWAFAAVAAAWAGARVWLGMRGGAMRWPGVVASGGLTAVGLAAMAVLCS